MPVLTRAQRQAAQMANLQASTSGSAFASEPPSAFPPPATAPTISIPESPGLLPHENLRLYVQSAKVPKARFPRNHPVIRRGPERVSPANAYLLSIEPDSRFRLKQVWLSKPPIMGERATTLIHKNIPSEPIPNAESRGIYIRTANFSLPAKGFWTFNEPSPQIDDAFTLAQWTMQVLETAERVVNMVWPEESKGLRFTFAKESSMIPDDDASICAAVHYEKVREEDLVSLMEPKVKMVVIVMPPWALAPADIYDMLTMGQFPSFRMNADGTRPTFTRAQKVWAQIYDSCASRNCPFFILTTYEQWIFGAFQTSSGWSRVIATSIMEYSDTSPSILEWVIFWCASAIKLAGGWSSATFTDHENPDIASPSHLQIEYSNPGRGMSDRQWVDNFWESWDCRTVSVTTKIEGHHNCYITNF